MRRSSLLPTVLLAVGTTASALRAQPVSHGYPPPSPELIVERARSSGTVGMHPAVILRDSSGQSIATMGGFVNYQRSCGACHDSEWIGQHGYHFRVGIDETVPIGRAASGRAWDFGPGLFGRWDPLSGYDSVPTIHATGAEIDHWIAENRARLAGGGPAMQGEAAREYLPNCALCHVRGAALDRGRSLPFAAYQTAALEPLGLVTISTDDRGNATATWKRDAFLPSGAIETSKLTLQAPSSQACGSCHEIVRDLDPGLRDWTAQARMTETTGQLFVPTRISASTLNVVGRDRLQRPWDVHAERLLTCVDCHFSPNNPSTAFRPRTAQPEHLRHEVRSVPLGEFLRRPSHEFAKGQSTQGTVANALDGTMRRCEDCHDAPRVHGWLPQSARHLQQIACETCHVDIVHAPARRVTDYSVVDANGQPRVEYRGIIGDWSDPAATLPGYLPLLLRRTDPQGNAKLFPYNVITTFYWVVESPEGPRPASLALLKRALHESPGSGSRLLALLDRNRDGQLEDNERVLVEPASVQGVREQLVAAGARSPRLVGELQPYGIHHGMAPARFALRRCEDCHAASSRLSAAFELAAAGPYGVLPTLVGDSNLVRAFTVERATDGQLILRPNVAASGLHVFGLSRPIWLDRIGIGAVGLVLAGALGHALLRVRSRRQRQRQSA